MLHNLSFLSKEILLQHKSSNLYQFLHHKSSKNHHTKYILHLFQPINRLDNSKSNILLKDMLPQSIHYKFLIFHKQNRQGYIHHMYNQLYYLYNLMDNHHNKHNLNKKFPNYKLSNLYHNLHKLNKQGYNFHRHYLYYLWDNNIRLHNQIHNYQLNKDYMFLIHHKLYNYQIHHHCMLNRLYGNQHKPNLYYLPNIHQYNQQHKHLKSLSTNQFDTLCKYQTDHIFNN